MLNTEALILNRQPLAPADVLRVIQPDSEGKYAQVGIAPALLDELARQRAALEQQWLAPGQPPVYGFNTGVGSLKSRLLAPEHLRQFQRAFVRAHSAGVGPPFSIETVRAALLLRVNSFVQGHSGIRPVVAEKLLELLNLRIHPYVPQRGSLGASGDLAPLAHVAAVLTGEPEAALIDPEGQPHSLASIRTDGNAGDTPVRRFEWQGRNYEPLELEAKEAMAITNGATFILAEGIRVLEEAAYLLDLADLCAALSLEAMLGESDAFVAELHAARGLSGQSHSAERIRHLIAGSQRTTEAARRAFHQAPRYYRTDAENAHATAQPYRPRVQDRYSLRCVPQVHGASRDALAYVRGVFERELNAATDNPLVFLQPDGVHYRAFSGGNFHGQPLALPLDTLAIALAELGNISDRRTFALLNEDLSYGLPSDLMGGGPEDFGFYTGLMIAQYTGAALVSENKTLAHPASVDSIPSSANQEDHVSMGTWGARKARLILENLRYVLAIELVCAVQALHISGRVLPFEAFPLGHGTGAAFAQLGERFPYFTSDLFLHTRLEAMQEVVARQELEV